jgi:hypothetical protein
MCCLGVFLDAFQTIILPRRPAGRLRITRMFYVATWTPWSWVTRRCVVNSKAREQIYSVYGPLSLLLLLLVWAVLLVIGFASLFYSMHTPFQDSMGMSKTTAPFRTDLYVSGTTLFTLGLGDVVPRSLLARALVIFEAGTGLGFVALVIGYVPVLYQAFSRREVDIALLDARAGSPPTSAEMLRRHSFEGGDAALIELLAAWERWSAEILESHISYPLLCYYRSQHDNQSWLAALTAVLDTCALLIAVIQGPASRQAQLTFAMSRHALIDLGHVFHQEKKAREWAERGVSNRLGAGDWGQLCGVLGEAGMRLCGDDAAARRLEAMRGLYEPHAMALSEYLGMALPGWVAAPNAKDQWVVISRLREQAEAVLARNGSGRDVEAFVEEPHEH